MENDKKVTAVEWLVEQLTPSIALQQKYIDELKEQAKQMEKQHILDAYHVGYGSMLRVPTKDYNPKQYFKETFKNK
jgi:hypothetical protein